MDVLTLRYHCAYAFFFHWAASVHVYLCIYVRAFVNIKERAINKNATSL